MLFAGSTEGTHRACVLGIVATCRAFVIVPVQAYLTWPFERLSIHRDVFALPVEQITPAAFKRTRGADSASASPGAQTRLTLAVVLASLVGHTASVRAHVTNPAVTRAARPRWPRHRPCDINAL